MIHIIVLADVSVFQILFGKPYMLLWLSINPPYFLGALLKAAILLKGIECEAVCCIEY